MSNLDIARPFTIESALIYLSLQIFGWRCSLATVLIVDDLISNAQVLARLLRRAGYNAYVVGSGPEALGFIDEHKIDLVLLDVMMPGMDGIETLRILRADPEKQKLPVLMYSADGTPEHIREAEVLGAQGYIVKGSTNWPQLEAAIRRHIQAS